MLFHLHTFLPTQCCRNFFVRLLAIFWYQYNLHICISSQEAIECVKEIDLPGAMRQVVVEGINHTLERKAVYRPVTGELFSRLVQEKVISQHDFSDG